MYLERPKNINDLSDVPDWMLSRVNFCMERVTDLFGDCAIDTKHLAAIKREIARRKDNGKGNFKVYALTDLIGFDVAEVVDLCEQYGLK